MSLPASRTRCARDWPPASRTLLEGWANAKTYRTGSACRNAFGCPGCQWPGVFRRPSSWPDDVAQGELVGQRSLDRQLRSGSRSSAVGCPGQTIE